MSFKSIMTFSLLVGADAFQLQPSTTVVYPGLELNVTWTSNSSDPKEFTLGIYCLKQWFPLAQDLKVETDSRRKSFSIPNPGPNPGPQLHLPIACSLKAFALSEHLSSVDLIFQSTPPQNTDIQPPTQPSSTSDASTTQAMPTTNPHVTNSGSPNASLTSPGLSPSIANEQVSPTTSQSVKPSSTTRASISTTISIKGASINNTTAFPIPFVSSTPSIANIIPMGNSTSAPDASKKRPIGAIVGGVLGGVFGLAVIVAAILYCRRKHRNSSDLMWTTRDTNASPSPSLEENWDAKAVMHEDIFGNTSAPPNHDYYDATGRQDPDMPENKNWTSGKTKEEEFELEQARRREEIYERMRRVLDNDSNSFDSNALHR